MSPQIGGCLAQHWKAWADRGAEDWVINVLRDGYVIPFVSQPLLSSTPISLPSYSPNSTKGRALAQELIALQNKGAVELAPPTPGFYSRMFVVMKAPGAWRPIIDLSTLNKFIDFQSFKMETPQSVLQQSDRTTGWSH